MSQKKKQSLKNIIILFIISFLKCFSASSEISNKRWDEHSLLDYVKQTYIAPDNLEDLKKLHFLIVDPNEYLKNKNLYNINNNLNTLYQEFNVTTFIYIINAVEKNTDLNYKLNDFASSIFSEISKYNNDFDEFSTISAIFRMEDQKMHVRLGSSCRDIIYDFEALSILKKREKDLEKKNIEELLKDFTKELLSTYRQNYEIRKTNRGNTFWNKRTIKLIKLVFVIMPISIFILLFYYCKEKSNKEIWLKNNDSAEVDIFNNWKIQ